MREPTHDEETLVLRFFEAAQKGLAQRVLGDRRLAIDDRPDGRIVTLAAPALLGLEELTADAEGGLRIGTIEDSGFALDLQGAIRWARHTHAQTVRVTEKAARLWVYGRNILAHSVDNRDRRLEPGDACIVVNPRGEAIGIGEVGIFKGKAEAVLAVHDLGQYLRDQ